MLGVSSVAPPECISGTLAAGQWVTQVFAVGQAWLYKASTDPPSFGAGSYGSFRMGQYGNAWKQQMQREASSNSTSSKNPLRPAYVEDEDGVWRCGNCLDEDERDFGAFRALRRSTL